jgi:DNA-binding response OmpR family regulator
MEDSSCGKIRPIPIPQRSLMPRIVIIDDSKLVRDFIFRTLEGAGHSVLSIDPISLFDVLKATRDFKPEVVITDFHMPTCSAESLVRAFREDRMLEGVKILVLTARHDGEMVDRMLNRGVDAFVFKGNITLLLDRIKDLTS